ncbi:MAG: hypothetical protein D3916_07615 [Candidatus Electrothrix sp. MAN1_4]|nr:hypothetical protein [Candidatus Electrothrix sp. MAN1_4]
MFFCAVSVLQAGDKEILPTNTPIGDMIYSVPELYGVFLRAVLFRLFQGDGEFNKFSSEEYLSSVVE